MESVTATLLVDCHNQLGEGILYDDIRHALLWTDIYGQQLHVLHLPDTLWTVAPTPTPTNVQHDVYQLPKQLCSFGLLEKSPVMIETTETYTTPKTLPLLCAWEDGFDVYDVVQQVAVTPRSVGEDVNPLKGPTRLNDGRVDPTGRRFICGGYYGDVPGNYMKVFAVECTDAGTLTHRPIVDRIQVTNSICWSPSGDVMYLADSPTKQIQAYQYHHHHSNHHPEGTNATTTEPLLSHPTLLHEKDETGGVPDGSCVDADGHVWNAVWRPGVVAPTGSYVERIHPTTGDVVFRIVLPDATSQVTCCCWASETKQGPLNVLCITTAAVGTDPTFEPHAGGVYMARVPFLGRRESRLQWTLPV